MNTLLTLLLTLTSTHLLVASFASPPTRLRSSDSSAIREKEFASEGIKHHSTISLAAIDQVFDATFDTACTACKAACLGQNACIAKCDPVCNIDGSSIMDCSTVCAFGCRQSSSHEECMQCFQSAQCKHCEALGFHSALVSHPCHCSSIHCPTYAA